MTVQHTMSAVGSETTSKLNFRSPIAGREGEESPGTQASLRLAYLPNKRLRSIEWLRAWASEAQMGPSLLKITAHAFFTASRAETEVCHSTRAHPVGAGTASKPFPVLRDGEEMQ